MERGNHWGNPAYEEKHLALDALGIRVKATPDSAEITGIISLEIRFMQPLGDNQNPIHRCINIDKT